MKKTRRTYSREFKLEAFRLAEDLSGKSLVPDPFNSGIGNGNLWRWRRKLAAHGEDAFPGHGRQSPEQERIRQLERENEILRQERDILKKAVAIFSHPSK